MVLQGMVKVDPANRFGVKDPIRKAIIIEDWFFNSANDIVTYLDKNIIKVSREV